MAPQFLPEIAERARQLAEEFCQLTVGLRKLVEARQVAGTSSSESQLGSNTGHVASTASCLLPIRNKGDDHPGGPGAGKDSFGAAGDQHPVLVPSQGFKKSLEARDTRKAPPQSLDMARLRPDSYGAPDEKPTHFLAVPVSSPTADFSERHRHSLEQRLTAMNPTGSRVILARSPRAVLRPEDIRSPVDQCQIREVPENERHFPPGTAFEKGHTATPTTAPRARERPELKRDAEMAGVAHGPSQSDGEEGDPAPSAKRLARLDRVPSQGSQAVSRQESFRLLTRLSVQPELIVRVCKHLPAAGILTLYSVSYDFYDAVNQWMRGSVCKWAEFNVPSARWVFDWRLPDYQHLASEAPAPWHSALPPAVRKYLEDSHEPEAPTEEANLKAYLESRGIDTRDRKGKEVTRTVVGDDGAGRASKPTIIPRFRYQRVVPTIK